MRNCLKLLAALAIATPCAPVLADDVVILQPTAPVSSVSSVEVRTSSGPTLTTTSSSESIEVKKGVQFKFRERLSDLQKQINTAVDKGWLTSVQAADFRAQADRLMADVGTAESLSWPPSQVDVLEKSVTKLNADISSASTASNGGSETIKTTVTERTLPQ